MRKLVVLSLILAFVLVINVIAASAAVTVTCNLITGDLLLGGKSQDASNPEHDDENKQVSTVFGTVTITNTEATQITITGITPNYLSGFTSITDVNLIIVSGQTLTIPAGDSTSIQLQGKIPEFLNAVDSDGKEIQPQVATPVFTVTGGSVSTSTSFKVFMQRKNQLSIQDVKATVNDLTKTTLSDSDDLKNIKPGDKIHLDVKVENNFRDRENLDIQDIDLTLTCDDESSVDINEPDSFDVSTNSDETDSFDIDVDEDADSDNIKCTILAIGTDENGAVHGEASDFTLKIERESHDIRIKNVQMTPEVLACSDKSIQVTVDLGNIGKRDEKDVAVELESRTMDYVKKFTNIELDQDDSQTETFDIPIPANLESGAHLFQIRTFYETNKASDSKVVQVDNACGQTSATTETGTSQPVSNEALSLTTTTFATQSGSAVSIPVKVTNTAASFREFTVTVTNGDEFAEPVSGKTLNLASGQTSTVFLNMKVKDSVEAGKYSANVNLLSAGKPVSSETVSVDVAGEKASSTSMFSDTRIFWIVADVILVLVAIFFIRLIFRRKE